MAALLFGIFCGKKMKIGKIDVDCFMYSLIFLFFFIVQMTATTEVKVGAP